MLLEYISESDSLRFPLCCAGMPFEALVQDGVSGFSDGSLLISFSRNTRHKTHEHKLIVEHKENVA